MEGQGRALTDISATKVDCPHEDIQDWSATLENGVYGLLGTNGAGKTTLNNSFMGIIPAKGDIFINGRNISARRICEEYAPMEHKPLQQRQ